MAFAIRKTYEKKQTQEESEINKLLTGELDKIDSIKLSDLEIKPKPPAAGDNKGRANRTVPQAIVDGM